MDSDRTGFWSRLQSGVEVAVASALPDKLLGVRDGFLRYFREGMERPVAVAVVSQPLDGDAELPLSDGEILGLARARALELQADHGDTYAFYVGTEAGIVACNLGDEERHLVRSWTVILGLGDESWGSSGSLELPPRLIAGLDRLELGAAVPGTRRHGGSVAALTGGLESRRSATALSTLHALSTLLYGILESGPVRRRGR